MRILHFSQRSSVGSRISSSGGISYVYVSAASFSLEGNRVIIQELQHDCANAVCMFARPERMRFVC